MLLATNDPNPGSVTFRSGCVTTSSTSSDGVPVPPWSKTARAFADSVCAWSGLPLASSARIPPMSALRTNTAMVPRNHAAATGHRWRELHIATRTVAGSLRLFAVSVMAAHSPPSSSRFSSTWRPA
jgi:hypothetical protein